MDVATEDGNEQELGQVHEGKKQAKSTQRNIKSGLQKLKDTRMAQR